MISQVLLRAREFEAAYGPLVPEEERPVFHLTASVGWLNDPNGFSVYRGAYHLFYQYHPYSTQWGPMHWGHVTTEDFVRWERLPAALAPDRDYDSFGCWSGGAVELPDGRQLLMYTGRRLRNEDGVETAYETQCLAVGDGRDYEKCGGNPVLTGDHLPEGCSPHDFRDPKLWRDTDGTYHAVTVTKTEDGSGAALLFGSRDGFVWRFESVLDRCRNQYGTMWECPDFFPLDGKQVLMVSPLEMKPMGLLFHAGHGVICLTGSYDGHSFTREQVQSVDHGPDFYAAQTLETLDGRRVMTAWMQNWASVKCQRQGIRCFGEMILPRELSLRNGQLIQNPVRELENYRGEAARHRDVLVREELSLEGIRGRVLDMTVTVRPALENGYHWFQVSVAKDGEHMTTVRYDPENGIVRIDRSRCGVPNGIVHVREFPARQQGGCVKLRFLMDRHSLELFVNDGEQAASMLLYTPESAAAITFETDGGAVLMDVEKYELNTEPTART